MGLGQVLGLGKSGTAAAQLLLANGYRVQAFDSGQTDALVSKKVILERQGIEVCLGRFPNLSAQELPELMVVSPGISWQNATLNHARELGVKVIGEVELGWQYLNHLPWVGITGTNGKTTTTALVAQIWQTGGLRTIACGNIGVPMCEVALNYQDLEWVVAELSSYQIESAPSVSPQIGIWTTFTPDHLDRHGTLANYSRIKGSLLRKSKYALLNGDDAYLASVKDDWQTAIYTRISEQVKDGWVWYHQEKLFPLSEFQLLGEHNLQNLLLAVTAAKIAGIDTQAIVTAVRNFQGIPHRLEVVHKCKNLLFINDSKATNYDAAIVGLRSVNSPIILIAGGQAKIGEPQLWLDLIKSKVSKVLLIGSASELFAGFLNQINYPEYEFCEQLETAIARCLELSYSFDPQGQVTVLFSPACASFDQFANFEQRGDRFRELCQQYQE